MKRNVTGSVERVLRRLNELRCFLAGPEVTADHVEEARRVVDELDLLARDALSALRSVRDEL